jgi:predicted HD phosphohydrolase
LLLEGHLYSHINGDGSKDAELEKQFSRLESFAAPVVEKINRCNQMRGVRLWT